MRFSWGAIYALLFLYRCVYSVLAQVVVMRLTGIGDTTGYQMATITKLNQQVMSGAVEVGFLMERNANLITKFVGALLNAAVGGNAILINIGFQTIAFVGLVYFLSGLPVKTRIFVLIFVATPSFSVWSSMASKEAIVVFLVCVLARYIVDIYQNRDKLRFFHLLAIAALYLFKPQFFPAVIFLVGTSKLSRYLREPATFALMVGTSSLLVLYVFRDVLDSFSRRITAQIISEPGNSQRDSLFIVDQYDFYFRAPEGFFRAFMGPTVSEASTGILQLMSLVESGLIFGGLAVFLISRLTRIPVFGAVMAFFTVFWTMLANYPLGLANPGTAIRYRTDYILLIILAVVVLTSRDLYLNWRSNLPPIGQPRQ